MGKLTVEQAQKVSRDVSSGLGSVCNDAYDAIKEALSDEALAAQFEQALSQMGDVHSKQFAKQHSIEGLKEDVADRASARSERGNPLSEFPGYSNGKGRRFQGNAVNDSVTYVVPTAKETFNGKIRIRVRRGPNVGSFRVEMRHSGMAASAPWVSMGPTKDFYSSSTDYVEHTYQPPSPVHFTNDTHFFRFVATGKHSSSSSYNLYLDWIQLSY